MSMRIILALAFIVILFAVAVWDLYCAAIDRPNETVSFALQSWGREWPVLPLAIGLVIGHVFWPARS